MTPQKTRLNRRQWARPFLQCLRGFRAISLARALVVGSAFVFGLSILAAQASFGVSSWYGEEHRGKPMANGQPFDPDKFTVASWFYPFGTRLLVQGNGRTVVVTVTDRGPAPRLVQEGRLIDLSAAAFRRLAPLRVGLVQVTVRPIQN